MFSFFNSLSKLISRIAVLGTPSSSASSLIFFSATICPELMSFALYTTPYVPTNKGKADKLNNGLKWLKGNKDNDELTFSYISYARDGWSYAPQNSKDHIPTFSIFWYLAKNDFLLFNIEFDNGRWRMTYRSILDLWALVVRGRNKKSVYS